MQNNDIYMINCPNCKQPTIECSNEDGLLTDWCDDCNTSIFDDCSKIVPGWPETESNREQ